MRAAFAACSTLLLAACPTLVEAVQAPQGDGAGADVPLDDDGRDDDDDDDDDGASPDAGGLGDDGAPSTDAGAAVDEPDAGSPLDEPLRIAVLSDLNGAYGSTSYGGGVHDAVASAIAAAPDVVLSTGDMVAGQQAGLDYRAMWTGFHAAVSDPLAAAGIPFAPTPGNHDGSGYPAYAGERGVYVDEWSARRPDVTFVDDADYPLRYAFTAGPALFVSLDATRTEPFSAEQRAWVAGVLEENAARPVKVVYGHVPLHPFTQGRESEVTADAEMEAIFVQHDVTLFISGHHHAYYPGRHTSADGALRVVSTACLGDGPRKLVGTSTTSARSFLVIDVAGGAVTSLEAFTPDGAGTIARSTLPESLSHGGVTVVRDDL